MDVAPVLNTSNNNDAESSDKTQHLYKVLVIGDYAVGKTSLIKRYTEGYFTPNYKLTIGVDFAVKTIDWDDENVVNLQLWDVAGHERFGTMTRVYYKYAIAAIIVFDLQRPATFEAVLKWREDVNNKVVLANDEPIPCLLLANKCDLPDVVVDEDLLNAFCEEHNFIGWYATSAATNANVDEAVRFLIKRILEVARDNKLPEQNHESISVSNTTHNNKSKSDCCN